MKNKYSLNAESYGIPKVEWAVIKKDTIDNQITSDKAIDEFILYRGDKYVPKEEDKLCKKRVWFLYDILLQEKYNHLYKRDKLVNPKVGDYVYCDYEGFGRGEIKTINHGKKIMFVEFDKRKLQSLCSTETMTTTHDDVKRKITKL